jgi:hypothetical protein
MVLPGRGDPAGPEPEGVGSVGVAEAVVLIVTAPGMCLLLFVLTRLETWLDASEAEHAPARAAAEPVRVSELVPAETAVAPEPVTLAAPSVARTGPAGQAA